LATIGGIGAIVDAPNRHALTYQLVGRDELPNAVALNSSMFSTARTVGPAVGGVLIALVGAGWCFALNALSFLAILTALALMRRREFYRVERQARVGAVQAIRDGLS